MAADIDIDGVVNALLKEYGYREPEPQDPAGAGSTAASKSARTGPDANVLARLAERRAAADQRKEVYCEVCGLVRVKSGSSGVPACERCYKRMAILREGRKEALDFYSDPRNTRRSSRRVKKYIQDIIAANRGRDLEIREDDIPPRPAPEAKPAAPVEEKPAAPAASATPTTPAAAAPSRAGRLSAAEILAQFEEAPVAKKAFAPAVKTPAPGAEKPAAPVLTPAPKKEKPAAEKPAAPAPTAEKPATPIPALKREKLARTPAPAPAASGPAPAEEPSIDELLARIGEFPEEEKLPVSRSERRHMAEASISRIERRAAETAAPRTERTPAPAPASSRGERHSPEAVSRRAARPAAPAPAPAPAATAAAVKGKPSLEEMLTPLGGAAGPLSAREGKKSQPAAPAVPKAAYREPAKSPVTETPRPAAEKPTVPAPAPTPAPAAATEKKSSLEEMLTPLGGVQESGPSRHGRRKSSPPESPAPAVKQPEAEIPAPAPTAKHAAPESPAPAPAEKHPAEEIPASPKPPKHAPETATRAAERSIDEILSGIEIPEGDAGGDIPTAEMLSRAERALQGSSDAPAESEPALPPYARRPERRAARPDAAAASAPIRPSVPRQDERLARKAYRPAFSLNRVCQACGADEWIGIDGAYSYIELCNNCEKRKVEFKKQDYVDSFECPYCGGLTGVREENKRKFGVRCSNCGELTICFQKVDELMMDERLTAALTGYARALVSEEATCPQCGSESITTGTRGIAFLGLGKPVNRCARCGYTWTPEWSVG